MDLPDWNEARWTADQVSKVLARPRSTIAGHISRYPGLMIEPVVAGATRRFSLNQVTALTFVRQMVASGLSPVAINKNMDEMRGYAHHVYVSAAADLHQYSSDVRRNGEVMRTDQRVVLDFQVKKFAVFIPEPFGTDDPHNVIITDRPTHAAEMLRDLQAFPLPNVIISVDVVLKVLWSRALTVLAGFDLED